MCRKLRERAWPRALKHREVAAFIGIATTTYGNVETSAYKVINRERAERLAELYELGPDERAELLGAWDRCPLSEYGKRRRDRWDRQRSQRSKVRHYVRMQLSLVEVLSLMLSYTQGRPPCSCSFGGGTDYDPTRNCEVCEALDALGIPAELDEARLAERLAKLQAELETTLRIGSKHDKETKRIAPDRG